MTAKTPSSRPKRTPLAKTPSSRPKRTPLAKQAKLKFDQKPGYMTRVVNEEFGRIEAFLTAGWKIREGGDLTNRKDGTDASQMGSAVRRVVNKGRDASAHTAVVMEIPIELYNEDYLEKQKDVDEIEKRINPQKYKIDGADFGEMSYDNRMYKQ